MTASIQPIVITVAVAALLFFVAGLGKVSSTDAKRLIGQGALLVDVRTTSEFAAGHLPGAMNIPVQNLSERLGELGQRADAIVLYCRSGSRSGRAKRLLESKGFTNISDLGAMSRW
jgi:phage shock protein E